MKVRSVLLIVAAVMALASMASAVQVQLPCVANAREGNGWDTGYLFMQGIDYGAMRSFFKFDVSAIPAGAVINSATVHTYVYYSAGTYDNSWQYAAREVLTAWGESGPMFPSVGSVNLGSLVTMDPSTWWITSSISPALVQAWVNWTKPNYGVCISRAVTGPEICVRNREAGDAAPYMLVDYTPGTEPVTGTDNLIANGGFEVDGALSSNNSATGWAVAPYSNVSEGTSIDNPHSGSFSWVCSMGGPAATVPMVSQAFATSAPSIRIEGWIRTTTGADYGVGLVRIRENKTGPAGTVRIFKNGEWITNAWPISAGATWYDQWDCYAMSDQSCVVVSDVGTWVKFYVTVPRLAEVTSYVLDISEGRFTALSTTSENLNKAYFDDITVTPINDPSTPEPREIIKNGGFEQDGAVSIGATGGSTSACSYWKQMPFCDFNFGTDSTAPHSGTYCWSHGEWWGNGNIPNILQLFQTERDFKVSGWARAAGTPGILSPGFVRVRENKIGPAGTVRYWNARSAQWTYNTVAFTTPDDYYYTDPMGTSTDYSLQAGGAVTWKPFEFNVVPLPDVSEYVLELAAPLVRGGNGDPSACWDDISISSASASVIGLPDMRNPFFIQKGTATVDGDLADWSDAKWTRLGTVYDANPTDIREAYYAVRWSSDKIYVAAKVRDSAQALANSFINWNGQDGIEVYVHTTGTGDVTFPNQEQAQQFAVGVKADRSSVWSCFAKSPTAGMPNSGFQTAGKAVGDWIYYEVAITPFNYYGGLVSAANIADVLKTGGIIGLDVVAVGNNGSYTGMMAENGVGGKSGNYNAFGLHQLDDGLVPNYRVSDAKSAREGAGFEMDDAIVTSVFYGDSELTVYPGISFAVESPTRESGIRAVWNWYDSDPIRKVAVGDRMNIVGIAKTISGERLIVPSCVVVTGNSADIPAPVALSNVASGGGSLGGQAAVTNNVATGAMAVGLNNVGLLTTIYGKVTKSYVDWVRSYYFDGQYFYVDDGSKLNDGSGFSGILCRPAGDMYGPFDPLYHEGHGFAVPDEGRYVSVTGVMGVQTVSGKLVRFFWTGFWNYQD